MYNKSSTVELQYNIFVKNRPIETLLYWVVHPTLVSMLYIIYVDIMTIINYRQFYYSNRQHTYHYKLI